MNGPSLAEAMSEGYGIERQFVCHVHDDHSPSASVNSLTGLWCCYSCGASGKFNMDTLYEDPYHLRRALDAMQAKQEVVPKVYCESWLSTFDAISSPYWRTRYTDQDLIRTHRLGEDPHGMFATIPMRDEAGRVLGVIQRDLSGDDPCKYRYPYAVVVGKHLYNYHRLVGDTLLITEGATDAIAAEEAGFGAAVALYGSKMTRAQAALVHRYAPRKILIATDQDAAGEAASCSVQALLSDCYPVLRLTWTDHKDLNSIPLSDRVEMLGVGHLVSR